MRKNMLVLITLLLSSTLSFAQDNALTPYEIALERIAEAERTGATSLDLSNLGLEQLPPEIGNLQNLFVLYAYDNNLTHLPPEIGNLSSLGELYLPRNQLQSLPSEIGNLANLRVLSVSANQLISLPPEIGNLQNLARLRVDSNWLTNLPSEIGNLANLRALSLINNELSGLPPEIANLPYLCLLNVQDNQFRRLPLFLSQLENLNNMSCIGYINVGLYTTGNPLIFPPQEILNKGTRVTLDFLANPVAWYLQRYRLWIAGGIGLIVLFISAIRWRLRSGTRKPKEKLKRE